MSSDYEEEVDMDGEQRNGEEEKTSLIRETGEDDEKYSFRGCIRARSFRLCLLISLFAILLIVIALAITVGILLTAATTSTHHSSLITLEDIFNSNFTPRGYSAEWTEDNLLLHQSIKSGVILINPLKNTTEELISSSEWMNLSMELGSTISSVVMSRDREMAMLVTDVEKVYRHSYVANYTLYDLNEKKLSNITLPSNANGKIQLALWSPLEHVIAYVLDFNIYVFNITADDLINITTDGASNIVYNGIPDWVYEEEILATNYALWWAPDGDKLLYARFNDSLVEEFEFPLYGSYLDPSLNQYTTIEGIAYPKSGTPNPLVSLFITDLTDMTNHTLNPPSTTKLDHYFVFAGWTNSSVAMVTWMNRSSDSAVYCLYSEMSSWQCELIYDQNSTGWIELVEPPSVLKEDGSILTLASKPEGDDSFLHIREISPISGRSWRTTGKWEVTSIVAVTSKDILYISTLTNPAQRHLYSTLTKNCLTCSQEDWNLPNSSNPSIPSRCDYFSASCSPSLDHCLLSCSGPAVPYTLLVRYDGEKLTPVRLLEENAAVHEAISNVSLPTVDFFTIPATKSGPSLNGQMMYPPGFKSSHQYPLLVYVYGGPYSQQVANRTLLSSLSLVYLCSNLSMIVAKVDGRGTGFRGDRFKFSVYKNLGHFETIDQIRAGRYLQNLKYVDSSKLAIYGSSYGGYMAGMVGSSGSLVYSAAISQAPVTSWYYYDSIYTERYMDQPQNNEKGYQVSSVLSRAKNLSDVDYLLIHGTGDDNVHFQHTAHLVQALTEEEIQFRVQFYTDEAHALSGEHTQTHLYELIAEFLSESFGLNP